jgi:hypothetical protein
MKGPLSGYCRNCLSSALLLALGHFVSSAQAQIYTLNDLNSSAQVNVANQAGMFNWTVDGKNYLNTQWFWLGVGNGAPTAINNLGLLSATTPDGVNGPELVTTYGNVGYNVSVNYLLTGAQPGSGQSDISETISLNNTSTNALTLHFYQYSDFNFGSNDTVQLGKNIRGMFDLADVTSASGLSLSETVATPGANEGEAGIAPSTLNKLNNGVNPVTLDDVLTAGPAANDATWAFQWDVTIAPGGSFLISKDKALDVPEPGCLSLLSLGLVAFAARKFRRIG